MNWLEPIDAYCERTGPEYWSEPVNALTNLAFLVAAILAWRRLKGPGMALGKALAAVLCAIGMGSWLFHTHANRLTAMMDVLPIMAFILLYLFAIMRDFFNVRPWQAGLVAIGFVPYTALTTPLWANIPWLGSSASYVPVLILLIFLACLLRRRRPDAARGLALAAGLLAVSLTLRTVDAPLCQVFPLGTHFSWHILNAILLGGLIELWRRCRVHRHSSP